MLERSKVVVVGGGVGGLVAAIDLARRGYPVSLLERAPYLGGKLRTISVGGKHIDAGPTVMTMRWVFDELFAAAGRKVEDYLSLERAELLARHAWPSRGEGTLDLYADVERSIDAIGRFAGAKEARGYRAYVAYAQRIFETVEQPFLRSQKPSFGSTLQLAAAIGVTAFSRLDAHRTMHKSLRDFFADPRLVQLFGRYATYSGSSPFEAPATLHVIAHVEQSGVWYVRGGMVALARGLEKLALELGVELRTGAAVDRVYLDSGRAAGVELASGERIDASAVVFNGDVGALASGLLGSGVRKAAPAPSVQQRSLSALTFSFVARPRGFELARHNVFFSSDYAAEFRALREERRIPGDATIYLCAQDRDDDRPPSDEAERFFALVNAPADGDKTTLSPSEIATCKDRTLATLERSGLVFEGSSELHATTPGDFERLFPGTGGALYGAATHGMTATFARAGARTKVPGLYLAGGSVHPGAGVPMAATSGRLSAAMVDEDLASIGRSRATGTHGGTWT